MDNQGRRTWRRRDRRRWSPGVCAGSRTRRSRRSITV